MTASFLSQTARPGTQQPINTSTNMQDGGNGRYIGSKKRKIRKSGSELPDYSYLLVQKDPRMQFDKDPIYAAFDVIDNAPLKIIIKKFFKGEL